MPPGSWARRAVKAHLWAPLTRTECGEGAPLGRSSAPGRGERSPPARGFLVHARAQHFGQPDTRAGEGAAIDATAGGAVAGGVHVIDDRKATTALQTLVNSGGESVHTAAASRGEHGEVVGSGSMARVWMPLPDRDFDVTEVAVPWKLLVRAGHEVVFATEDGATPAADPLLLRGVIFGQLGADPEPRRFYAELQREPAFARPVRWASLDPLAFDALILPGGHAKGMRQFLEGRVLRERIASFWVTGRPVGAICHGTVALARTLGEDGRSVLFGRRTTCLPKRMERAAWLLTAWKLGDYYRTYPEYVEDEVRAALKQPGDLDAGPLTLTARGTMDDDRPAFVVQDGSYVSARWPGDAYLFARRMIERLEPASATRHGGAAA